MITATNVLLDSSGFPLGSRFSDLIVKFFVGKQAYEATVLTNQSRTLPNNQFEIAVQVPNTVPLGESRIVLSRKQNEKVSPNPSAPLQEVKYDSTPYRIENDTQYIFAAQWTADRISLINGANPAFVVGDTNSSDLSIASIAVGTDDILDRPRELTVTSDGSRAYVVMDRSGRVAVVDPMTRQQVDTQPNTAGINPINLPSGSEGRSIVIDPRDQYAYIADGKIGSNSIYVLDINPFSPTYHQITQTIPVGTAPNGLRQIALSSDGKKLFVTAPNGLNSKIYAVNIDPKDRPISPGANPKKWNQLIGTITADEGVEGIASTVNPLAMTFTNSGKDSKGFGVLDITNNDPLSFAATTRYANLGLGSDFDYFDVNEGVAVTVMPDASYAFVVGRNNNTASFGREIPSVDGDPRAGSNIGIIKDPLTNPQLVGATRPIPGGLTTDLVLSNDSKYLYASYPSITGAGRGVYLFDIEEFIRTLSNPGEFQLDSLNRGSSSPLFNSLTARPATVTDFARVPIDDINPAASLAADYQILTAVGNRYTYGTPAGSKKAPVPVANARGLAATPLDWLELIDANNDTKDLTPTFEWSFDKLPTDSIQEVNLFVSVFDEGEGLLPWDEVVDLPDPDGNEFLSNQGLSKPQQLDLLTKPWNTSFYRSQENDFNPNRILTATWQKDSTNVGKWTFDGGKTFTQGTNTSFTLPENLRLTAGQEYNWAVEAWNKEGKRNEEFGNFWTPLPSALNGDNTFSSVTVLTHGFKPPFSPPFFNNPGIPSEFYQLGNSIANAGIDGGGLMMKYDLPTGYWVPVNKYGAVPGDFPSGFNPQNDPQYLTKLESYIAPYLDNNEPLVLLNDWSENNESAVPDSGFTEGAADAFFTSLVQLDGVLKDETSTAKQGAVFNSPLHFVGFSRGTVVNSEIIQRLGTYFPDAGGKENSDIRDLQMTTLDPHDFDQPGLNVVTDNFGDFREPKVQVWKHVTFADNYYQTVPNLLSGTVSPAGRNIPNLPPTEDGKTAPGLKFPREGWRSENPDPNAPLLGEPDLSVFLGTNKNNPDYNDSRAGFTKETDPTVGIAGRGAVHGRVLSWYGGTSDLFPTNFPFNEDSDVNPLFRRRGDGYREPLFDKDFSFGGTVLTGPARVTPWYTPEHGFQHGVDDAPWEGIGTGWFYSVLGGGKELRPQTDVERIPVDFENTYDARMRGDGAIPTLFNGNFDALFNPTGLNRTIFSDAIPGWSLHNGETSTSVSTSNLVDVNQLSATDAPALHAELDRIGVDRTQPNYALKLESGESITHNRFVVPEWGTLRFNLHVPELTTNGKVKVSIKGNAPNDEYQLLETVDDGTIDLRAADGRVNPGSIPEIAYPVGYANTDTYRIGYGNRGFETFHVDIPEEFRGEVATLKFEADNGTVYLDDVFFKSISTKLGNPSLARSSETTHRENYLIEKPQYTLSYNDATKGPNWVSWQLNKSWLGEPKIPRPGLGTAPPGYPPADFPEGTYPAGKVDYPWLGDSDLPSTWVRTEGPDYRLNERGMEKGHMTPVADRDFTTKDIYSTFLTSNMLPQHNNNNQGAWQRFEENIRASVKNPSVARDFYIVAGGYGYDPNRAIGNKVSVGPDGSTVLDPNGTFTVNPKGILIPDFTWKIVVPLVAGQSIDDITANTEVVAIMVPNRASLVTPRDFPLPGETNRQITSWSEWRDWRVSIDYLEGLTGYNFLSNLPETIQEKIEERDNGLLPS